MKKAPTAIICLSPNNGGMEMNAIKLAKKLSPFMNIVLIAKKDAFIANSAQETLDLNVIQLKTIKFKRNFSPSIIFNARKIMKEYAIKNVIFFGASELRSLYFSFLGLDINLIVRHGTTKTKPKKSPIHKLVYSNVNTHLSVCKHLQKNVEYIVPFAKQTKSVMIYTSLSIEPTFHQNQNELTLSHIGRIAKGKGQSDAILACDILHKRNIPFKLYLLGSIEENYKQEFLGLLNNITYKDSIILVGFTTETKKYLSMSDIFLFPSWGEGLSNAFIEALAAKIPCICYDNTSFPELQELGFYFKMVENKNINVLSKVLLEVVDNLETETENSARNFGMAEKYFSLDTELNNFMEILR